MHVAHLEAGTLACQAARAERRDAPLVSHLRQRVVLVHELRQLAGAEELLHNRRYRLGVDEFLGHEAFGLGQAETLLDGTFHPHQADAELVFGHFADAADATVAEVVDIVHRAIAVADVDQHAQHGQDVLGIEHARTLDLLAAYPAIELHAPDA